jgi:AraC-like DNA-binding protein
MAGAHAHASMPDGRDFQIAVSKFALLHDEFLWLAGPQRIATHSLSRFKGTGEGPVNGTPILPISCLILSMSGFLCMPDHFWSYFERKGATRVETARIQAKTITNGSEDQQMVAMRGELAGKIASHIAADGVEPSAIPGMHLYRRSAPTACTSAAYEPRLIVFVQGEKQINMGTITHLCDSSTFLLTSVDMPVLSQVTKASKDEPILGMMVDLDMPLVREILSQQEFHMREESADARAMAVGVTSPELLAACMRLVELLDAPQDIPYLAGLTKREIFYRLLRSPQGKHLRAIATLGEQSHRTSQAVEWLRANYTKPLRVEELATRARMGVSTLHHQFRSLTAMSPLQYQKQLRLHVARERMLNEGLDAASAAFEVGYESASQFSREYSRLFGRPPARDVKARRQVGEEASA